MSRGASRLAWLAGGLVVLGLGVVAAAAQRTPLDVASPVSVITRDRLEDTSSVLFDLPGRRVDQIVAELPANKPLSAGRLPEGWSLNQRGREVRLTGPATDNVAVRLDAGKGALTDYAGKEARIRTGIDGRLGDWERVGITSASPVFRTENLDGILTVPPQATPGAPLAIGVAGDYRRGVWTLNGNGGALPLLAPDSLNSIEIIRDAFPAEYGNAVSGVVDVLLKRPAPQPFVTVFPAGGFSRVQYTDPFGEMLVDAPLELTAVPNMVCPLSLGGGSALTFAGQAACVSGCFPDAASAFGLMMDGTTELAPWGISPTTLMLGLPADTPPGVHTITLPGSSQSITIGVIAMEGSLDQTKLWRGESTTMRLRVVGTEQPFPLTVLNRTPSIIDLEGGTYQVLQTPGGLENAVTRSVRGIQRGNFAITYSVNTPGCGQPSGM